MYRPNEVEEKQLLELSLWIEKAREDRLYPSYVIGEISTQINHAWEHIKSRHELCSEDVESTKQHLIDKYSEEGSFSEMIKHKIEEVKDKLHSEVYDHFMKFAENEFKLYLAHIKYQRLLMIESGWFPRFKKVFDLDIEKEAKRIQTIALTVNKQFIELTEWIESLRPNETIDDNGIKAIADCNKDIYISKLFNARKKGNPLKHVQDAILKDNSIVERSKYNVISKIDLNTLNFSSSSKIVRLSREERAALREASTNRFYQSQEEFYTELENWAKSIANPYCRDWIYRYLRTGRNLPIYKIRVFKYIEDIEKAKEFLLSLYERKLEKTNIKEQERNEKHNKYREKHYKSDLRFYKEALKESSGTDYTENSEIEPKDSNNTVIDYPLGYAGTWAHDEAGYSNDDIDTIFDGDPDAYWNTD
jgi:hypothetical protein